jgi:hypothetical protein
MEITLNYLASYSAPPATDRFKPINSRELMSLRVELEAALSPRAVANMDERAYEILDCDYSACRMALLMSLDGVNILMAEDEDGRYFATVSPVWMIRDEVSGVWAEVPAGNEAAAMRGYVDGGNWGIGADGDQTTETVYVAVSMRRYVGVDEECEPIFGGDEWNASIRVDPKPPAGCEHEWVKATELGAVRNVYGNGGGVRIHSGCRLCGCGRVRDTWGTDRETGRQGLEKIEYHPGKYEAMGVCDE